MVLVVNNIHKAYNIHPVLNGASFVLNRGERAGLVGANGVGKSTLVKIIVGALAADSGSVTLAPDVEIGYLAQAAAETGEQTVADLIAAAQQEILALESRMRDLEAQMADTDDLDAVLAEYAAAAEAFERRGGYDSAHRTDAVLNGLKVGHIPRQRRFSTLSGGEKARVGLALLLLRAPDVLLLDEPTNHLDFDSLTWLEDYLAAYQGAVLIVSHDRHFLNRSVNSILEISEHERTIKRYAGDYDAYHAAKTRERAKWEADYAAQQEEIKALRIEAKETARRNDNYRAPADGDKYILYFKKSQHASTVSKRVRAAEEKLKRIEANPIPRPPDVLRFTPDFDPAALQRRSPLEVTEVCKAYGGRAILNAVSFALTLESRVVLVAPNGAGKSTLLKILVGLETPDSGSVRLNPAVRLGYLAQEQDDDSLNPALTLFEAYQAGLELPPATAGTALIKSGLFRYEDFDRPVSGLSAGQRRKLQIARLIAGKANLLVLDEPTNYVSFDVLEGFEAALRAFPGPVIAASHDRRFIETFGGALWTLQAGRLVTHLGGLADYSALDKQDNESLMALSPG